MTRNSILILAGLIFLLSTRNAYAYLDPGTGSMLLQGLIGGIAGGLFAARLYWGKLKGFFARTRGTVVSTDHPTKQRDGLS